MKRVFALAFVFSSAILTSALADRGTDGSTPVLPVTVPSKPDQDKVSYAIGMNLGLQRQKAKSDVDVDAFCKGLQDMFENKKTEIPFTDSMNTINAMRARGTNATAAEKRMFAYAMGMRWGNQLKDNAPDCDTKIVVQALKDATEGRPLKLKESELQPLLDSGRDYALYVKGEKNREEGKAFLAAKAKEPGVHVVTNNLLYRVIKEGTGPATITMPPKHILFIKYKGSFLDGREFDHHNRFPKGLTGGWPAWTEALKRMKVGDHWQVYSPPEYTFGREGEPALKVGPDSTVIWDLEVREIVSDEDPRLGGGRLGHGLPGRDDP